MNDQVNFTVEIGNVCETDTVSFDPNSLIPNFTYALRTPAQIYQNGLTVLHDHVECPVVCSLTLANGGSIPPTLGISDPGISPYLEIFTGDKSLNGLTASLKFTCTSVLSKAGAGGTPAKAVHIFDVTYEDECYLSNIFPALGSSATVNLYSPAVVPLSAIASSALACGPLETQVVLVTPDDPSTPIFTVNDSDGTLVFDPQVYDNVGSYTIVMRSCIYVLNDPLGDTTNFTPVCEQSVPFTINIVDPCLSTVVLSDIFSRVMTEPQLSSDQVILLNEMPTGTWPWVSQVGVDVGIPRFGYDVCGTIDYSVLMIDEFGNPVPGQTLVQIAGTFPDLAFQFQPTLDHAPA